MTIRRPCSDDVCLWADGTWCLYEELEQMSHMSDDYELIPFGTDRYDAIVYG